MKKLRKKIRESFFTLTIIYLIILAITYSCSSKNNKNEFDINEIEFKKHYFKDSGDFEYLFSRLENHKELFTYQKYIVNNDFQNVITCLDKNGVLGMINYKYFINKNQINHDEFYIFSNDVVISISNSNEKFSRIIIYNSDTTFLNLVKNIGESNSYVNIKDNPIGEKIANKKYEKYKKYR
jgi:hypothetical protein